jgi:hypothetical protein
MDAGLSFDSPRTLRSVADGLPSAEAAELYWDDPESDAWEQVHTHNAVANADSGEWIGIVTDEYEIINPPEFLEPLADVLEERDRTDVSGSFRVFDSGAGAHGRMLFDSDAIWPPDRDRSSSPVRVGISLRFSHDGGVSVRSSGFAQDTACKNSMRKVTDSVYVKHSGDVDARVNWESEWDRLVGQLGVFSERLGGVIESAFNSTLFDLTEERPFEVPLDACTWHDMTDPPQRIESIGAVGIGPQTVRSLFGYYDYLGFPAYLSLEATDRLVWRITKERGPLSVSAWDAYSAITYALAHEARFETGSSSDDNYHRIASDILLNPSGTIEKAQKEIAARATPDDAGQQTLGIEGTVGGAIETYREREDLLREAFSS